MTRLLLNSYPDVERFLDQTSARTEEADALHNEYIDALQTVVQNLRVAIEPDIITEMQTFPTGQQQLSIGLEKEVRSYFTPEALEPITTFVDRRMYGDSYHFYMGVVYSSLLHIVNTKLLPELGSSQYAMKQKLNGNIFGGGAAKA